MKYDDIDWHNKGSEEEAASHLGMFVAWLVRNGLVSRELDRITQEDVDRLMQHEINGTWILENRLDGSLSDGSLTDEGNAFVKSYYDQQYYDDFGTAFAQDGMADVPIEDNSQNFEILKGVLDQRFAAWKQEQAT